MEINFTLLFKPASDNLRPLKLFSAALQLSLEIVLLEKNQQNHWNFRKIWPFMSLFFENAALGLIWVGRRWFKRYTGVQSKNNVYHIVNKVEIQCIFIWILNLIDNVVYVVFALYSSITKKIHPKNFWGKFTNIFFFNL